MLHPMSLADDRVNLVVHAATTAFGDGVRAAEWLATPNPALDGRRPIIAVRERLDDYGTVLHLLARRADAAQN